MGAAAGRYGAVYVGAMVVAMCKKVARVYAPPPPSLPRDAFEGKGPHRRPQKVARQAFRGGCPSGWGPLLSVTDAIEAGTWRQGDSGWA